MKIIVASFLAVVIFLSPAAAQTFDSQDASGYFLPSSGTASTTQFLIGPEFGGGTACGAAGLPSGSASGSIGSGANGPGYLYAAINQLAFGANPSSNAGGPGAACGVCYQITPINNAGQQLTANALTFRIVDECPAASGLSGGTNCNTCSTGAVTPLGTTWTFDIAIDAMSSSQYTQFFNGVTNGANWKRVHFQHVSCAGTSNNAPPLKSWGCNSGCKNNAAAKVCAGV